MVEMNQCHTCTCIFACVFVQSLVSTIPFTNSTIVHVFFCSAQNFSYNGDGFFEDEVEYQRGYQCLASTDHDLTNVNDSRITAKVTVMDFSVQAFEFKTAGEFGNCE